MMPLKTSCFNCLVMCSFMNFRASSSRSNPYPGVLARTFMDSNILCLTSPASSFDSTMILFGFALASSFGSSWTLESPVIIQVISSAALPPANVRTHFSCNSCTAFFLASSILSSATPIPAYAFTSLANSAVSSPFTFPDHLSIAGWNTMSFLSSSSLISFPTRAFVCFISSSSRSSNCVL